LSLLAHAVAQPVNWSLMMLYTNSKKWKFYSLTSRSGMYTWKDSHNVAVISLSDFHAAKK
jgi:hypothetical protein